MRKKRKKKNVLAVDPPKKASIADIEALLSREEEKPIRILPNGEIRADKGRIPKASNKPLTMRENLGGEYAYA